MSTPEPSSLLLISEDRMSVLLARLEPGENLDALALRIEGEMNRLKLRCSPSREGLLGVLCRAAAQAMAQEGPVENVILAEGRPPVPARDAVMEWTEDFFDATFHADATTGRVDYRHHQAQNGAEEGQCLARLHASVEGKSGSDVLGNPINVKHPVRIRVRLGPGVRMTEEDGVQSFFATQAGRVRWAMNMLAVDNLLEIHGDVGMESGDIAHPGAVLVRGDVQAGSSITATGDIEIQGSVEPSDITAGGNLIVRGGLTGAKGRRVRVGGGIIAKFINEACVDAGGDVAVESEMLNTTLQSRGELRMPHGRVIGGQVLARNGIQLLQAGSDGHIPTLLCTARDEALIKAKAEKQALIANLEARANKIHQTIDPLMARQARLNAEQRENVTLLMSQVFDLEQEVKTVLKEIEEMNEATANLEKTRIVIREKTYGETTLQIGTEKMTVVDDVRIPVTAVMRAGRVVLI